MDHEQRALMDVGNVFQFGDRGVVGGVKVLVPRPPAPNLCQRVDGDKSRSVLRRPFRDLLGGAVR